MSHTPGAMSEIRGAYINILEPRITHWDGRGNAVMVYDGGVVHMQTGKDLADHTIEKWIGLERQNAELLEALRLVTHLHESILGEGAWNFIHAAIAKAEGK